MLVSSTPASSWPAKISYLAAGIFIAASGSVNLVYGIGKGSDLPSSVVWGAVSLAASGTFALSWPALIRAASKWSFSGAAIAFVALLLSGAYSISAALGSAGGGRLDAANQETASTAARQRAQRAYDAALADLAKLAPSRPAAEVEALLSAARPQCRVDVSNGRRDTVCNPPPTLTAELARARQRLELQNALNAASVELSRVGPARTANSDAKTLSRYMQAIGADISSERLNDLLTLLTVALVEMGGGLSLALGLTLSAAPAGPSERKPNAASVQPEQARTLPADAQDTPLANGQTRRPSSVRVPALEEWLHGQGGRALIGMRGLGAALGCSPTKAHEQVRRAAAAGVVRATPGSRGTTLELVARLN